MWQWVWALFISTNFVLTWLIESNSGPRFGGKNPSSRRRAWIVSSLPSLCHLRALPRKPHLHHGSLDKSLHWHAQLTVYAHTHASQLSHLLSKPMHTCSPERGLLVNELWCIFLSSSYVIVFISLPGITAGKFADVYSIGGGYVGGTGVIARWKKMFGQKWIF